MHIAHFLHIYQPTDQQADILEKVTNESYRPLIKGLRDDPNAKIVLNINAALTELFVKHGYQDVIDGLKFLAERGQIEFTGSAKYHAFLPLIPEEEIRRQIEQNTETNRALLGDIYRPAGFFSPEMAYSNAVAKVVSDMGFSWMMIDEIAHTGKNNSCDYEKFHSIQGTNLIAVFRERRTSNLIMGAVVRRSSSLKDALADDLKKKRYLVTAMDGETFGHHRTGHDRFLFEILGAKAFKPHTVSELLKKFPKGEPITPHESTWSTTEHELAEHSHFLSWKDPQNTIHQWQWEFTHFTLERVQRAAKGPDAKIARANMDHAIASDHFWWASAKPWWSLEMIELGSFLLLNTLRSVPGVSPEDLKTGEAYYQKIVLKAFEWQRTGYIRNLAKQYRVQARIPFKDSTAKQDKPYEAFIALMKQQIKKAVRLEEFEQATLWRDAIRKIETGNDIYDAMHAVDLLRLRISNEVIEKTLKKYRQKYDDIAGGQPETRGIV